MKHLQKRKKSRRKNGSPFSDYSSFFPDSVLSFDLNIATIFKMKSMKAWSDCKKPSINSFLLRRNNYTDTSLRQLLYTESQHLSTIYSKKVNHLEKFVKCSKSHLSSEIHLTVALSFCSEAAGSGKISFSKSGFSGEQISIAFERTLIIAIL